jgi:hypothetical protein
MACVIAKYFDLQNPILHVRTHSLLNHQTNSVLTCKDKMKTLLVIH